MDSEPYCVYNWLGLSFEGPDRDDWWVHDFLLAMPNATYDIFPKFLKLPPELPLRVYDYVFGYQEITSTLDRDGQMRIHDIEDEGTVASGLASGTINVCTGLLGLRLHSFFPVARFTTRQSLYYMETLYTDSP